MERTKLLVVAVIGLIALNLLTLGYLVVKPNGSSHPGPPGPHKGDGPATVIIERLHFDPQQQQQYRKLVRDHQQQSWALSDRSVQLYQDFYGLLASRQPDTVQANALSTQIAQNQRALAQLNYKHFAEIKALCRADQQAYFINLVGDLSRLFGRQQRPGQAGRDRPKGDNPENLPSRP